MCLPVLRGLAEVCVDVAGQGVSVAFGLPVLRFLSRVWIKINRPIGLVVPAGSATIHIPPSQTDSLQLGSSIVGTALKTLRLVNASTVNAS